ncbi:MAG: riboflavin synthase [Acidimicrobiaceae bacterium]|jgi:riboflavin synthase|nr:riboflavin synthase [Acidimicrobiaceae bacterium]MDP6696423.1 riboflavin synthase [Acidimicrobiales bacterium]|tara:strand:- start:3433 stop:4062 length:630 start_codon:yes stop_codon:yes gene_type:complete
MFTGIIEETGEVRDVREVGDGRRLVVSAEVVLSDVVVGASICVDGCCLTVVEHGEDEQGSWFGVDAVPETLDRTTLGGITPGEPINLERSMAADGRFGGHIVQGHVDTVTVVEAIHEHLDGSKRITFRLPSSLSGQIVVKGSVCLDGVSLTVAGLGEGSFDVAVVPHTLHVTTLGCLRAGDSVNVEVDVVARYVAGLVSRLDSMAGGQG